VNDSEKIAERLKEFGLSKFGSLKEFAEALKISPEHLSQYVNGKSKPGNKTQQRLRGLGCDIEWLMTGKKSGAGKKEQIEFLEGGLASIPVFEYARAGAKTMMLAEKPSYYISSTRSTDDSRFGIVVKGISMEPEIREGDVVVVSKKRDVKNGDLCLVIFEDGETCLRRVYLRDRSVTLTSANEKEYPPTLHKKSEIRTMYRMVQKITNY
jgi:repressor LexA